jgi:hypothetical protein
VKCILHVLVEAALEGFGESFRQLLRELREVKTFECIDFLFGECHLNELFH